MKHRLLFLATAERLTCALALALAAGAAHAQWTYGMAQADMLTSSWYNNQMWKQATKVDCWPPGHCHAVGSAPQNQAPSGASVASLYTGADFATTAGIDRLAASFPTQNQQQIAQVFKTLIVSFNQTVPRTYGIPVNNLATAFTAVLAGSYAAYTNQPFPENAVKPLYQQLEQVMLSNSSLSQGSMEEKNTMYQMWVGLGTYMLGWQSELAKHPNAQQQAQMQKAGANILRSLNIDPDRVSFTDRGMQMR